MEMKPLRPEVVEFVKRMAIRYPERNSMGFYCPRGGYLSLEEAAGAELLFKELQRVAKR